MKKIISTFILCTFLSNTVRAEEKLEDGDYVEVTKGEQVPFDGYLFDQNGIAALVAKQTSAKEKLVLQKDTEYKKLKLDLETELKKKDVELDINKRLNEEILRVNKEQLKLTQDKLDRVGWLSPTLFVGGIVAGAVLTISILKVSIGVIK